MIEKATPIGVFFADSHLDLRNWATHPQLRGDSLAAFQYICRYAVDLAESKGMPGLPLICAGDLLDERKPPSEVVQQLRENLERVANSGFVNFYFIQGQHDLASPPWASAAGPATHLHRQQIILRGGMKCYGLDWVPGSSLVDELSRIPADTDLLVCHQVWQDLMGSYANYEGSFSQIPVVNTVFTGDFHQTKIYTKKSGTVFGADRQPLTIISPGSTNLRSINEPDEKVFFLLTESGLWKPVPIPSRPIHRLQVSSPTGVAVFSAQWESLLSQLGQTAKERRLPEAIRKPILHVRYDRTPELAGVENEITAVAGNDCFLFFTPTDCDDPTSELEETVVLTDRQLRGGAETCLHLSLPETSPYFGSLSSLLASYNFDEQLRKLHRSRLRLSEEN